MKPPISLCLFGSSGKMGQALYREISNSTHFSQTALPEQADLFIDFSSPAALPQHLAAALEHNKPFVLGTTGLSASDHALLKETSSKIPLFVSSNFSFGIALALQALKDLSRRAGKECSLEIVETHHTQKKDAPSGTAITLAHALGVSPQIIRSIRQDDVVGIHQVLFRFEEETISVTHEAASRSIFAKGALRAAAFLHGRQPGYYTMEDLLD